MSDRRRQRSGVSGSAGFVWGSRVGGCGLRFLLAGVVWTGTQGFALQGGVPLGGLGSTSNAELRPGRELLQDKQFADAKSFFAEYLRVHPGDVQGELGLGDAALGLRQYEAAEASYRAVVARQPELWQAHKNLVVVEAALGRWEEFDGERKLLRLARERDAPGISARESDVIDSFEVKGERWVVRAYFEPVGRSRAVYNFERFSSSGRVEAYVSLEDAAAGKAALTPGDVRIGRPIAPAPGGPPRAMALNWYSGSAHGTIREYPAGEPSYERVRADVVRWLKAQGRSNGLR